MTTTRDPRDLLLELTDTRTSLASARLAELETERELKAITARSEASIIHNLFGDDEARLGSNEQKRKRTLLLALEKDVFYIKGRDAYESAVAERITLEAKLEAALDVLRVERLNVLDRLATSMASHPVGTLVEATVAEVVPRKR